MEENKEAPKPAHQPPKKKVPRDVELKFEIRGIEHQAKGQVRQLEDEHKKKHYNAMFASTNEVGKHCKERDAKLAVERQRRDQTLKEAEKAKTEALRKVQSDYDKATIGAKKAFEDFRDALEVEVSAKTRPLREDFEKTEKALKELLNDQVQLVITATEEKLKPLVEELQALEAKAKEKSKTSTLPDAPPAKPAAKGKKTDAHVG